MPVEITWMSSDQEYWADWDLSGTATPFTPYRFSIPYATGFKGRAIYLDADMLVLDDIAALWKMDLRGKVIAARGGWRFDTMLMDTEAIREHMLPLDVLKAAGGFAKQNKYFAQHQELVLPFGYEWNYLDVQDTAPLSDAKLLHFTDLRFQPSRRLAKERLLKEGRRHWYPRATFPHPRPEIRDLFHREYAAALAAGYTPQKYYADSDRHAGKSDT